MPSTASIDASRRAAHDAAGGQGDVELLLRARAGDTAADAVLLQRHRAAVAELGPSEGFSSVDSSGRVTLAMVRNGVERDLPFRAAWLAMHARGTLPSPAERESVVWSAFAALPAAWRTAVWHREVEGQRPREIAVHLGMDELQVTRALASAYAALKRRVALAHSGTATGPECEEIVSTYRFSPPSVMVTAEIRALREHGRHCDGCLGMIRQLFLVEHTLRDTLAHVVLGAAAEDYLARRPRVARLRLPGPASEVVRDRRRTRPMFATISAATVGAAAMALALGGPRLSPVTDRAPSAVAEPPAVGSFLSRDTGDAAAGLGVRTPRPVTFSPTALDAALPDGGAAGGSASGSAQHTDGGGTGGPGAGNGTPTTPVAPTEPPPGTPTTPTPPVDQPPAAPGEDPLVTVNVAVSQTEATVEVDGATEQEPVVIEVPVPEVPLPDTSLPDVTGNLP